MADHRPDDATDTWRHVWKRPTLFMSVIGGALTLVVAVAFGILDRVDSADERGADATVPSTSPSPAALSPTSTPAGLACLVYTGEDEEPRARVQYDEQDFASVDCVRPHQYEMVAREADASCDEAVRDLLNLSETVGFIRTTTAEFGPYSCALGRISGGVLQTDTYRISSNDDLISAFGSCIEPQDVELFLSGSSDYERDLPCYTGRVLPASWSLSGDVTAQESCEGHSDDVRNSGVRSAAYDMGSGGTAKPGVRCAYTLWAVNKT